MGGVGCWEGGIGEALGKQKHAYITMAGKAKKRGNLSLGFFGFPRSFASFPVPFTGNRFVVASWVWWLLILLLTIKGIHVP